MIDWLLSWFSVVRCRRRLVEWRWRLASAERDRQRSLKTLENRIKLAGASLKSLMSLHNRMVSRLNAERNAMEAKLSQSKAEIEAARQHHLDDEALIAEIQAENRILQTTVDGLLAQNKTFEVAANAQTANYVRRQVAAAPKMEE